MKAEVIGKAVIRGPEDVMDYLAVSMASLKDEVFTVFFLDKGNAILAVEDLFQGTVDQAAVQPRKVIKRAFELNASGLIFVHNHPSGALKPSDHDKALTVKLVEACKAVDLSPLDHIILGPNGHFSLKAYGLI
jgi:DNA repair protein RadC